MGARQSKRSVDISSTPKKEKLEGGQEEKLEKIEEGDVKVQNGTAPHADGKPQETTENQSTENANEAESPESTEKTVPAVTEAGDATPAATENGEAEKKEEGATTPDEKKPEDQAKTEDKSEKKKKEKTKKKWSFRSISFSKKDKSKPSLSREESKSNDLAKEAPVPEETTTKSGSEETSPSEPEAATPAVDEAAKEIVPPVEKKTEETSIISDIKSAVCSLTSAAESEGTKIVEETKVVTTEAKEAINTIVEAGSKLIESGSTLIESGTKMVVEESKTTTITESASIIKTSTKTIEEMNGGGESMAEMPEENGLGDNDKLDDDQEDIIPKVNGHNESPVKVEEITECLLKTSIEEKHVIDNHLEVAVDDGKTQE
nr:myb-like protein X isoform X3 [Halyomorpha halys]